MGEMRRVKLSMFEDEDLQRVHNYAMELLDRNGIHFPNERALAYFKDAGFRMDGDQVFIAEEQVWKALETVPKQFTLHGINPERNLTIGDGDYGVPGPIGPVNVVSLDEERRPGTLADVENLIKIYQASDIINVNTNNGVEANDVDTKDRAFAITRAILKNTDKPFYTKCLEYEELHQMFDMVEIVTGDKLEPGGKAYTSAGSNPALSPLAWSYEISNFIIALSERGQCCSFGNATVAGVTGPITTMGMTVMQTAELLSGIVLSQLVAPGTPNIFGTGAVPANMTKATYCCGSPGRVAIELGVLEMGKRFYKIPARSIPFSSDSNSLDAQCLMESYEQLMGNCLGGADYMLSEIGTIEGLMTTSYEKTILDEELVSRMLYIRDGIDVSDEAAVIDEICEVGSGGNFLYADSTLDNMHDCWYPTYTAWEVPQAERTYLDFDYVVKRANEEWKRRLEEAPESLLDASVEEELDAYIAAHR